MREERLTQFALSLCAPRPADKTPGGSARATLSAGRRSPALFRRTKEGG